MNYQQKDLQYIWHPCSQMKDYEQLPPIIIERGEGSYLYDIDGKQYIDIISSWWCNLFGHCEPKINAAIKEQLEKIEHVIFANFSHTPAIDFAEKLSSILPSQLTKLNFSDNGSASVECALKMSFQYQLQSGKPHKKRFMCLSEGYHGETIGALSLGAMDLYAKMYKPMLMDVLRIEAPDCYRCAYGKNRDNCSCECFAKAREMFERFGDESCAIIIEPLVQGSAGMRIYPPLYLKLLRAICDEYGVLLIADEIATGFGRTGKMFACDHADISPDIMCLSKGISGGYMPFAVTAVSEAVYRAFYADYNEGKAFMHSHTYSGNPLGCAAALAVLKIFEDEPILQNASKKAVYLHDRLSNALLEHKNVGEIRHIGLINAIELVIDKKTKEGFDAKRRMGYEIYKKALTKGLLLRPLGNVLYFNPSLKIKEETIDEAVKLCEEAVLEILHK
ncbi:MAG: adenosylmethionine--8-amino-7-oxononanoate transaminase [Campylobacteraceae bacterium]|jgi:adenosylmethionine-8-amino-7-oxononanoate aminotransferase|nr:adenosylmethionine--8-amino-7-oxononanoate transaminase [Campylobacteraceae bacterium]